MDKSLEAAFKSLPQLSELAQSDDLQELVNKLREREFTLAQANVSSRVFNFWKEADLIDIPGKFSSKWIKFHFIDYVWICLVRDMRSIGISLKSIKKIKDIILKEVPIFESSHLSEENLHEGLLNYFMSQEGGSLSRTEAITQMEKMLSVSGVSSVLQMVQNSWGFKLNQLDFALVMKQAFGLNPSLIIIFETLSESKDKVEEKIKTSQVTKNIPPIIKEKESNAEIPHCFIWTEMFHFTNPDIDINEINKVSHLRIPISPFVSDFVTIKNNESSSLRMGWISDEEHQLLQHIRNDKANEIKITFLDGKIEMLHVTKNLKPGIETKLLRTFGTNEYGEIKYVIDKGKTQYIQLMKKFKTIKK